MGNGHSGPDPTRLLENTEEQLDLALREAPPTCQRIGDRGDNRDQHCRGCAFFGRVEAPLELGRKAGAATPPIAAGGAAEEPARTRGPLTRSVCPPPGEPVAVTETGVHQDLIAGLAEPVDDMRGHATAQQVVRRLARNDAAYPRHHDY